MAWRRVPREPIPPPCCGESHRCKDLAAEQNMAVKGRMPLLLPPPCNRPDAWPAPGEPGLSAPPDLDVEAERAHPQIGAR